MNWPTTPQLSQSFSKRAKAKAKVFEMEGALKQTAGCGTPIRRANAGRVVDADPTFALDSPCLPLFFNCNILYSPSPSPNKPQQSSHTIPVGGSSTTTSCSSLIHALTVNNLRGFASRKFLSFSIAPSVLDQGAPSRHLPPSRPPNNILFTRTTSCTAARYSIVTNCLFTTVYLCGQFISHSKQIQS